MADDEKKKNKFLGNTSRGGRGSHNSGRGYGHKNSKDRTWQSYGDNYGRKSVKRNRFNVQNDGKRKKLEVGTRLKESDIGVTVFVGSHTGFSGLVKERYTDFHVNEISLDGEVAKLTNQDIPKDPQQVVNIEEVKALVPDKVWEQLEDVIKPDSTSTEIDVTDVDKNIRKSLHIVIRNKISNTSSTTVDVNGRKILVVQKNKTSGNSQSKDDRVDWSQRGGQYCHFLLHKVNMDTMDALNQIGMSLRIKSNNFTYAGTKDRRAWTTQWVSLKKVNPHDIWRAGRMVRGAYVGNFKFAKEPLRLGMLYGNRFRIALRNMTGTDEQIEKAMVSLRDNGFINYYGLQRFGTVAAIPTHEIGKKLLQGKWQEAIELILKPRDGEQDRSLAHARETYAATKDAHAAYKKISRLDKIEATLLKGLCLSGDKNPQGALDYVPRNTRLMYIHSYQSFVWNHIVSRRIKEFGVKPIVGDLVIIDEDSNAPLEPVDTFDVLDKEDKIKEEVENDEHENDLEDEAEEKKMKEVALEKSVKDILKIEKDKESKNSDKEDQDDSHPLKAVKILTEEDLPNYTLTDLVMPQPGWKVMYPPYAKPWFDEFLAKDDLTTDLRQKNKKYSLGGAYRKMFQVPSDLSWKIVYYKEKHDDLIVCDIDEMRKKKPPPSESEGPLKALIVEMSLMSSTYATMALREILKSDTSPQMQAALSAEQDSKRERNVDSVGDSVDTKSASAMQVDIDSLKTEPKETDEIVNDSKDMEVDSTVAKQELDAGIVKVEPEGVDETVNESKELKLDSTTVKQEPGVGSVKVVLEGADEIVSDSNEMEVDGTIVKQESSVGVVKVEPKEADETASDSKEMEVDSTTVKQGCDVGMVNVEPKEPDETINNTKKMETDNKVDNVKQEFHTDVMEITSESVEETVNNSERMEVDSTSINKEFDAALPDQTDESALT